MRVSAGSRQCDRAARRAQLLQHAADAASLDRSGLRLQPRERVADSTSIFDNVVDHAAVRTQWAGCDETVEVGWRGVAVCRGRRDSRAKTKRKHEGVGTNLWFEDHIIVLHEILRSQQRIALLSCSCGRHPPSERVREESVVTRQLVLQDPLRTNHKKDETFQTKHL